MPTYLDGPWTEVNAEVPAYVPPSPSYSDGPWTTVNAEVPAYSGVVYEDGPWTTVNYQLLPAASAHKPIIVKRNGVLTRIRILTLADVVPTPIQLFRSRRAQAASRPVGVVYAGSSTIQGVGASTTAKRCVNLLNAAFQAEDPNGGTESTVVSDASAAFTKKTTPGIHGYNMGQGGATSANFFTESERTSVAALNPDAVVIMIGSNDYAFNMNPATTYKDGLRTVLADLRAKIPGVVLVLAHTYQRMDGTYTYPWAGYLAALEGLAAESPGDTVVVDVSPPFAVQGVPGSDPNDLVGTDGIHPTDAGHLLIEQTLFAALS